MHRPVRFVASLLVALALLLLPAHAGVLVVDTDGSGDFPDVQAAVDAAADGDVILVRGLHHAGFTIAGKSLTLVGLGVVTFDPFINGEVTVTGLAAGQQVVFSRLQLIGADGAPGQPGGAALTLSDCAGSVHLWRCFLEGGRGDGVGGDPAPPQAGGTALRVSGCADVALSTCLVFGGRGGDNGPLAGAGGAGLAVVAGSQVALMHTSVIGGDGGGTYPATSETGGAGGAGVTVSASTLSAGGIGAQVLRGGPGGAALAQWGDGGNGLELDETALARAHGVMTAGGASQVAPGSGAAPGVPGSPVVSAGGSLQTMPGTLPSFIGGNPVSVQGDDILLTVATQGGGGGAKLLLASPQCTSVWLASQGSPLLVAPPWIADGVPLPDGTLALEAPHLPPGLDAVTLQLQAHVAGAGLSNAQHLVLLATSPWD